MKRTDLELADVCNPNGLKIGDVVKRPQKYQDWHGAGIWSMSINTMYEIEYMLDNGYCVLKNYLVLVNPRHLIKVGETKTQDEK